MHTLQTLVVCLCLALASVARAEDPFGLLVMAHGGSEEWNQGVLDTVHDLEAQYPLEVAFGMADAVSLQEAVTRLENRGVRHIGVVRLFISGESWYERTAQILGLQEGAPTREHAAHSEHAAMAHAAAGMGHSMEFWRIETNARFALSTPGLAEAAQMADVLRSRAEALSEMPAQEDVLILAHGPEDDAENARWLAQMDHLTQEVRALNFRRVQVATLREDWPDKREAAEMRVRDYLQQAEQQEGTALVIPFRVHGFGPYAGVLEGLHYRANEQGLIPHPAVTAWIAEQAVLLKQELNETP